MNQHIIGIGVDLVENERMQAMLKRWKGTFKDRVFLPAERKYCDSKAVPSSHYAGRFAVKEAVSKAFGTGMGPHISWLDIEVVKNTFTGAPSVRIRGKARTLARKNGVLKILVSLSHTRNYAVAQALLVGSNRPRPARSRRPSTPARRRP